MRYRNYNLLFTLDNLLEKGMKKQRNRIVKKNFDLKNIQGLDGFLWKAMTKISKWNRSSCPKCGGKDTKDTNIYYEESYIAEYDIVCTSCNQKVNAYAYGNFEEPLTLLGQWGMELHYLRLQIQQKMKSYKGGKRNGKTKTLF